jgi:uncharacterized protein YndB with AHSA1/START domain
MGLSTTVTFTLTATEAGTHLRMEHAGFPSTSSHYYKGASYGWQGFLGKLEQLIAGL